MPSDVNKAGPICWISRKKNVLPVVLAQHLVGRASFSELSFCNDHPVIIRKRPETVIKQPVSILAECDPISGVVVTRIRELVYVSGIHDALP